MSFFGRRALKCVTTGLAVTFLAAQAQAQTAPIGEATQAKNEVTGQLGSVAQPISVGTNVSSDETVRTGISSSTDLRFLDTSTLNIGAESVVVLDRHIFDPNQGSVDTLVNMSKGALRFVGAGARTRNATISTPVATIGIRGTEFVVIYNDEDTATVVVDEGTVRVCPIPDGTPITPQFRAACLQGNEALLPCGYYDVTAEEEQQSDNEGNFMTVSRGCVVSQPTNVDPSAFNFLQQQIASGGPLPDPSLIGSPTFAITQTGLGPGASALATAAAAAASIVIPATDEEDPMSP